MALLCLLYIVGICYIIVYTTHTLCSGCAHACDCMCVWLCVCVCVRMWITHICCCPFATVLKLSKATEKHRISPANKFILCSGKSEIKAQVLVPKRKKKKKSAKYHTLEITNKNMLQISMIIPIKYHLGFKEENKNKKTWVILVSYTLFVQGVQMKIVDKVNYNTARTNWG